MDSSAEFRQFLDEVKSINMHVDSAQACYTQILAQKHALYNSTQESAEEYTKSIIGIAKEFRALVTVIRKEIEKLQNKQKIDTTPTSYMKTTHIKGLTERVHRIVTAFSNAQSDIIKEETERLVAQYKIAKPNATENELKALENTSKGRALIHAAFTLGNKSADAALQEAEKRQESIESLIAQLNMVETVAERIQKIVDESTDPINTLAYSVQTISHTGSSANRHLQSAVRRKKRRRTIRLICTGVCVFAVILLVVWIEQRVGIMSRLGRNSRSK